MCDMSCVVLSEHVCCHEVPARTQQDSTVACNWEVARFARLQDMELTSVTHVLVKMPLLSTLRLSLVLKAMWPRLRVLTKLMSDDLRLRRGCTCGSSLVVSMICRRTKRLQATRPWSRYRAPIKDSSKSDSVGSSVLHPMAHK